MTMRSLFERLINRPGLLAGLVVVALLSAACAALPPTQPVITDTPSPAPPVQPTQPPPTRTGAILPSATAALTHTPRPPALTPPPAAPVARGPYLQMMASDAVLVAWDTNVPSIGRVEFGPSAGLGEVAQESQAALHHAVRLAGLMPGTRYYYRVHGDRQVSSFRSAPAAGQTGFRFAVLGDTRTNPLAHTSVIQRILQSEPDLVLHVGDLVEDGKLRWNWDTFFKIETPLIRSAPFYPTLGNHEAADPQYFAAFHLPGNERWYSLDYGVALFIVLKADGYYDGSVFGAEQLSWLEEQLSRSQARWIFVTLHIPPFSSNSEEGAERTVRKELVPLVEKYRASVVFAGHFHNYERVVVNGIPYVVTGGGGAPLYPAETREPGSQKVQITYQFMLVEVQDDRAVVQAIDPAGKTIDRFEVAPRR